MRVSIGVTRQRLRTLVVEIQGRKLGAADALQALHPDGAAASQASAGKVGNEILETIRAALLQSCLHVESSSPVTSLLPESSASTQLDAKDAFDSMAKANGGPAVQLPGDSSSGAGGWRVDHLYVLQLRALLVNELATNLAAFAAPLDR